jgi:hypothetical protein
VQPLGAHLRFRVFHVAARADLGVRHAEDLSGPRFAKGPLALFDKERPLRRRHVALVDEIVGDDRGVHRQHERGRRRALREDP